MNSILDKLYAKQNNCEHKNVVRVKSPIIEYYYQCTECDKMSALVTYFEHYRGER